MAPHMYAENLVIVARYLTDDWVIKQEVCQLMLLTKSLTGEEVARQIISVISTEMGISSDLVVGAIKTFWMLDASATH